VDRESSIRAANHNRISEKEKKIHKKEKNRSTTVAEKRKKRRAEKEGAPHVTLLSKTIKIRLHLPRNRHFRWIIGVPFGSIRHCLGSMHVASQR
jgi:hypothetical protein